MLKRSFLIALLSAMVPMAAFAGNVSTRVMTAGGTATMGGTAQTYAAGTVTKNFFSTGAYYNASGVLVPQVEAGTSVTFAPASGYSVSEVKLNGVRVSTVSPVTVPAAKKAQSVTVKFARQSVVVTAKMATGGSVIPSGTKSAVVGTPLTYVFTPASHIDSKTGLTVYDNRVESITTLPVALVKTMKDAVTGVAVANLPYRGPVVVTFTPAAGVSVTLTPVFQAITVSAGATQSLAIAPATVVGGVVTWVPTTQTIAAATSTPTGASFVWKQVDGPFIGTPATKNASGFITAPAKPFASTLAAPSVTFPQAGNYVLQVTATQSGASAVGTVLIKVIAGGPPVLSTQQIIKNQCTNCHTSANVATAVYGNWSSSLHSTNVVTCATCHVGASTGTHPDVLISTTCTTCHSGTNDNFSASKHWVNSKENGPEFAGGAVANEINPNESWTTTEDGILTTCSIRCHFKPNLGPNPDAKDMVAVNRPGKDGCLACHDPHKLKATAATTCLECHSGSKHGKVPDAFHASKHWLNTKEYGPEFTGGAVEGEIDANNSTTTKENGVLTTCAYRCHFNPGGGVDKNARNKETLTWTDPQTNEVHSRPGGTDCLACHEAHKLDATYKDTCLTCHSGSKHGVVPNEFFGSKHWMNNFETGPEFANQINTSVVGGSVVAHGTVNGVMNANDSYTTTENGGATTCAYRCHFRPGMGPQKDVAGFLAKGKSTSYLTYSSPYGAGKFSRPGGDACMACHDSHGLEATARSTCYTCHAGGNHGWSVAAFEKSTHFTGTYAKVEGIGGPTGSACTGCHNAHSTEAVFFAYSTVATFNAPVKGAVGCQKCHSQYGIYDANHVGKAPHFQTGVPSAYAGAGKSGFVYPTGAYMSSDSTRTCKDCHYHNNTINKAWAKGGHASTTSIPLVPSQDDNWNSGTARNADQSRLDYKTDASVSDCIRCHTAQGFARYYDSAFSNVSGNAKVGTSGAPIACDACHVGTKGAVRPLPAGVTNIKTYVGNAKYMTNDTDRATTSMDFPANYANSNICIPCHAGRGTGDLIKATFLKGTVIGNEHSAENPRDILRIGTAVYAHFAAAAGVVNGTSAYSFSSDQGYQDRQKHKQIGTLQKGAAYGTSSSTMGPCVGCHMTSTEGHSLEAVTHDANGKINGFATPVCTGCHAAGFTYQDVQNKKDEFDAALNVLRNLLISRGFDGLQAEIDARPGERVKMNMAKGYDAYKLAGGTLSIKDFAERNTGASFNWWLFGKTVKDGKTIILGDPAAYVHNPSYARRIVFDSIDWLDDFKMDNSSASAIQNNVNMTIFKDYSGHGNAVITTVDAASKAVAYTTDPGCLGCHFDNSGIVNVADGKHYNNNATLVPGKTFTQAQFVTPGTQCNYCHGFGHGTDSPGAEVIAAYAESAHGDVKGLAWTDYNFLNLENRAVCTPCHTTSGFKAAVTSANGNSGKIASTPFLGNAADTTKQVLGCDACHSSTAWKTSVRTLTSPYVAAGTTASPMKFPNAGESNACVVCHSGRVSGNEIMDAYNDAATVWTNKSFMNSHYMASAGIMYMKVGFHSFTDPSTVIGTSTYGKSYSLPTVAEGRGGVDAAFGGIVGGTKSAHRALGTATILGAETWITDPATLNGNKGPCVTCHVYADVTGISKAPFMSYSSSVPKVRTGAGHTFSAVSADASRQTCMPCHNDANDFAAALSTGDFAAAAEEKLAEAKPYFLAGLYVIQNVLETKYAIKYDPTASPYFYDLKADASGKTPVTDWTRIDVTTLPGGVAALTNLQAAKLMGAAFNLNVLTRDKGAYVHGRSYSQRLIFDSIDYLNDLQINQNAAATMILIDPAHFPDTNDHWVYKAAGGRK